jgi:hypothetical protein
MVTVYTVTSARPVMSVMWLFCNSSFCSITKCVCVCVCVSACVCVCMCVRVCVQVCAVKLSRGKSRINLG